MNAPSFATRLTFPDLALWAEPPDAAHVVEVVVVPPDGDLQVGLRELRRRESGGAVALIGRGAAEVAREARIRGVELDAYMPNDKTPLLEAMLEPYREWLIRHFEGSVDDVPPEKALWSTAMSRFVRLPLSCATLAFGLAHHHGAGTIVVTQDWPGQLTLEREVTSRGGRVIRAWRQPRRAPFELWFGGRVAAYACASVAKRALEFARQSPSRKALAHLRSARTGAPTHWVSLVGHWPHASRHLVESVGHAARDAKISLGVLLQDGLQSGEIVGGRAVPLRHASNFPALDQAALAGQITAVDQICSAESWPQLARVSARALRATARATFSVLRTGAHHRIGPVDIDATVDTAELAQLLTIDILRTEEARSATALLTRRRDLSAARVAFAHASLGPACVADLLLQRAGATTYDVVHGALAEPLDMVSSANTFSTVKLFWTEIEVVQTADLLRHQQRLGGYVPRTVRPGRPRGTRSSGALRILALTNYSTRNGDRVAQIPRLVWQRHFFSCLTRATKDAVRPVVVRWRPHPGDDPGAVSRTMDDYPGLTRSTGSLSEDAEWCDLMVTSLSSVVVELLSEGVPEFIHGPPVHEAHVILNMFDPTRVFRTAEDLRRQIDAFVICEHEDPHRALAPERALRQRLFGEAMEPRPFGPVFLSDASSSPVRGPS